MPSTSGPLSQNHALPLEGLELVFSSFAVRSLLAELT